MRRSGLVSDVVYRRIVARVKSYKQDGKYQPAIMANVAEAPAISRPTSQFSRKLGRHLQLMSQQELHAVLLALYHPNVFEIHEQHPLSPSPASHPLEWMPGAAFHELKPFRGTVAVAQELGHLNRHPVVSLPDPVDKSVTHLTPFPYIGDLLLFLRDERGAYCVNWTVKKDEQGFATRLGRPTSAAHEQRAKAVNDARHLIEEKYFKDAGIRTVRVTGDAIDTSLRSNLGKLAGWHARTPTLTQAHRQQLLAALQEGMVLQVPPIDTVRLLGAVLPYARQELLGAMYQLIWERALRVDLYSPIHPDRPLKAETIDPLEFYSSWFLRG